MAGLEGYEKGNGGRWEPKRVGRERMTGGEVGE